MSFSKRFIAWVNENPWGAIGAFAGFLIGILILAIGFLNTLLIFLLAVAGYLIGKLKDENGSVFSSIRDFIDRIRNR
jgi:uncharacterized membrane protein